jgi:hypothetical protein
VSPVPVEKLSRTGRSVCCATAPLVAAVRIGVLPLPMRYPTFPVRLFGAWIAKSCEWLDAGACVWSSSD